MLQFIIVISSIQIQELVNGDMCVCVCVSFPFTLFIYAAIQINSKKGAQEEGAWTEKSASSVLSLSDSL